MKKDQSYVLYRLPREILSILFPLGSYRKEETRVLAQNFPAGANKAESQEICFVPEDDYKAYLSQHRPNRFHAGDIVDMQGQILGQHRGLPFIQLGNESGLGIAAAHPLMSLLWMRQIIA